MCLRVPVELVLAEYMIYMQVIPLSSRQLFFDAVGVDDPCVWPFDVDRYADANQRIRTFLRRRGGAA